MSTSIRRAGLTILFGSAGGMVVTMAMAPVISRLYSPAEFGLFAAILATASTMIGAGSLRLEVLAQAQKRVERQAALVKLAIIAVTISSLAVSIIAAIVVTITENNPVWILIGPMIWIGSAPAIGTATLVLEKKYKAVASQNFLLHSGTSLAQVLGGLLLGGATGLIMGFILGRTTWLPRVIAWLRHKHDNLRESWREARADAAAAGGSALLNSTTGQLLPIVLILTYGSAQAGLVAMALRVAISPMNVVGQAVSSAAAGEVGAAIRAGDKSLAREKIVRGMRDQSIIAAPISLGLAGAAPLLAGPVLGDDWSQAGLAIAFLVVGGYAQFVVAPFSQVLNFAGATMSLLRWDAVRLVVFGLALTLPYHMGMSWLITVAIYSVCQVPLYADLARRVLRAVDCHEPSKMSDPAEV